MSEADRARAWVREKLRAVCDSLEPWEYGTVALASRYPNFYEYNHLRVEREAPTDVEELIACAESALATRRHRRIDFEHATHGEPFRRAFAQRGWDALRLVRMRFSGPRDLVRATAGEIQGVPYESVAQLRAAWLAEDFPGVELGAHLDDARAVAATRGVQVLAAMRGDGTPAGYAELEVAGDGAEVSAVYVAHEDRGRGLGTALAAAAIRHAPAVQDLWITADADDRPQRLYARLGFVPVAHDIQFVRGRT